MNKLWSTREGLKRLRSDERKMAAALKRLPPIILPGSDFFMTREQVKKYRAEAGRSARYTFQENTLTAAQMIHDGVCPQWGRAIARMKVGASIRLDAGNGEYDTVTRTR